MIIYGGGPRSFHPTEHLYALELKRFLGLLVMLDTLDVEKVWPLNGSEATATVPTPTSKTVPVREKKVIVFLIQPSS